MSSKTVVTVTIGGEEYTLKSDRPAEYTRAAAEYVDRAVTDVRSVGNIVESHKAAILAALSITDELFQALETQEQSSSWMAERVNALAARLEGAASDG